MSTNDTASTVYLNVGFDLSNAGTNIRFVDQSYPLPTTMSFGAAYGLTKDFPSAVVAQVDLPRNASPDLRLGLEYRGFGPIALRIGNTEWPKWVEVTLRSSLRFIATPCRRRPSAG